MRTGQPNAAAKSNPTHPAPRLPGSPSGPALPTSPGNPIETAEYDQSRAALRVCSTISEGVSRGLDAILRGSVSPLTRHLILVPPMSIDRMLFGSARAFCTTRAFESSTGSPRLRRLEGGLGG